MCYTGVYDALCGCLLLSDAFVWLLSYLLKTPPWKFFSLVVMESELLLNVPQSNQLSKWTRCVSLIICPWQVLVTSLSIQLGYVFDIQLIQPSLLLTDEHFCNEKSLFSHWLQRAVRTRCFAIICRPKQSIVKPEKCSLVYIDMLGFFCIVHAAVTQFVSV